MAEPTAPPAEPAAEDVPDEPEPVVAEAVKELLEKGVKPRLDIASELKKVEEARGGDWVPKTRLGKLVRGGQITNIHEALFSGLPLREPEIVDVLVPDLADDVTNVNMVQRMTDSGRRVRFSIQAVVGNRDGYVGLGMAKGKEVGPSIRIAIDNAKLNLIEVRRGCGSWECGCGTPHTMPFAVWGHAGSTEVFFRPAPRGVGLAVGDIAKKVLGLAGVKDVWGFARGQTRTTVNAAQASLNALKNSAAFRLSDAQKRRTPIVEGPVVGLRPVHAEAAPEAPPGGGT